MEWIATKEATEEWIKKHRWTILVLVVGFALMILPDKAEEVPSPQIQPQAEERTLEQELEEVLSKLEGAGKVKVLLSRSAGEEVHYQTDEDIRQSESGRDQQSRTVLITGTDRTDSGLVRRVDPPVYLGAVVICQGADSASIRLSIVDAVGTATGLSTDRISVLKMK